MLDGSESNISISDSLGAVNGWCMAIKRSASLSYSNIGNSVTQTGLKSSLFVKASRFAISTRRWPSALRTIDESSPIMNNISPSFILNFSNMVFWRFSEKNLEIPPMNVPFSPFIHAKPFALYFLTKSVNSSIFFLEYLAPPSIIIPFTFSADLNALKSEASVKSFTSWSSIP